MLASFKIFSMRDTGLLQLSPVDADSPLPIDASLVYGCAKFKHGVRCRSIYCAWHNIIGCCCSFHFIYQQALDTCHKRHWSLTTQFCLQMLVPLFSKLFFSICHERHQSLLNLWFVSTMAAACGKRHRSQ